MNFLKNLSQIHLKQGHKVKIIIAQLLIFACIFALLFSLARMVMTLHFLPSELLLSNLGDSFKLIAYGAYSDIRCISIALLPVLACSVISVFSPVLALLDTRINRQGGGGLLLNLFKKLYFYLSSFYLALLGFVFVIFCFVNFYYYEMYKTNIDIFIFGIKDDETSAILDIVFKDYPTLLIICIALIFSAFCAWINTKILRLKLPKLPFKIPTLIGLFLVFIALYVLALRGPSKYVASSAATYRFSNTESFNAISLNPIMAFVWAYKYYKKHHLEAFLPADEERGQILQNKLFPLFEKSPKNAFVLQNKPHIMLNIMESFGTQFFEAAKPNLNLLGELEKHFQQDFVFNRFLSYGNDTAASLAHIVFNTPISLLKTQYKTHYLAHSPIELYKAQGYKVIFLTSGNGAWRDLGDFFKIQGIDELIDEVVLSKLYPQVEESRFAYGIDDKFMYQKALELFENETQPLLIIALTTMNHSPFPNIQQKFSQNELPSEFLSHITAKKLMKTINTYFYANNEFGKFLDTFKQSPLKDKVIIAATGDHRMRDFTIDISSEQAFGYAVPFYLYVPKAYQQEIYYDKQRIGSHKDIFPTLYALSLSEVEYLNMGGKNMLGKVKDKRYEFAYNEVVWLDEKGIYPLNSSLGYEFKSKDSLLSNGKSFVLDENTRQFKTLYDELNDYQLRFRLINIKEFNASF